MSDHRVIHGFLTKDPEVKEVGNTTVTEFTVALNRKYKKKDGTDVEEVHFADCTAWNKLAELIGNNFDKGQEIMCWGYNRYGQLGQGHNWDIGRDYSN